MENGEVDINAMIKQFSKEEDTSEGGGRNAFAEGVLASLKDSDSDAECPICMDIMQCPMFIPACMHQWCVNSYCMCDVLPMCYQL